MATHEANLMSIVNVIRWLGDTGRLEGRSDCAVVRTVPWTRARRARQRDATAARVSPRWRGVDRWHRLVQKGQGGLLAVQPAPAIHPRDARSLGMITIAKQFTFDAAHRLLGLPETHKCHRLHGHTYGVEIQLHGVPDDRGFIVDYAELAEAWAPIFEELDHRYLNDIVGLSVPSTEVLVQWIFERLGASSIGKFISAVKVSESSTTWALLRAGDYVPCSPKGVAT
jgi:6-pyruvoyltetrahydropterin/6-carboxytetrahydropterin synthase